MFAKSCATVVAIRTEFCKHFNTKKGAAHASWKFQNPGYPQGI